MNTGNNPTISTNQNVLNQQHVDHFLSQCGLSQYFETFIEEGFDRPESLIEITESDLIQMQVKRGHRRLLQRAVANAKGIPSSEPLNIPPLSKTGECNHPFKVPLFEPNSSMAGYLSNKNNNNNNNKPMQPLEAMDVSLQLLAGNNNSPLSTATNTSPSSCSSLSTNTPNNNNTTTASNNTNEYFPSAGTMTHSAQSGMSSTEEETVTSDNVNRLWKRKYHRHAKPDTNAPLKPPSAYVMFSNDVRAELKKQNKSFTDLAKIIGDRWKNISPEEKESYEVNALKSREEYLKKLEEYHKTDSFKKYQQYISDFKAENEAACKNKYTKKKKKIIIIKTWFFMCVARPVGRPRKRHRRDEDKYGSDGTVSDSTKPRRASSMSSQPEEQHMRTPSISSDNRQYPFYLLNEESPSVTVQPK
ncbi:hypothetical protein INT48_007893 [Thamnidium elegans]|uniref:HMG box domain-containing protein n=1 Tax=Thamnidium elegans TaxID=101142 RepID=A0A8H7SSG1_9FUNG|nr:hypothetical protein INT48_007893 [Thamnidium elegans]